MRHTIHIFIGDEMTSIAEVISRHLLRHGERSIEKFAHVAIWENTDGIRTMRILGSDGLKFSMEDDDQGAFYFHDLHDRIINIAEQTNFGDELYLCIYVQLYTEGIIKEVETITQWANESKSRFLIDVYGLSDDIAKVFCSGDSEIRDLIKLRESLSTKAKDNSKQIIQLEHQEIINRFLMLQNCNLNGIGLNLDKNTLIRIFGEYALLTTEQFYDVFPQADFSKNDVTAFGIAALWFDKYFFTDYLLSHTYLYVMERENVGQHKMDSPLDLLKRAKKYINDNTSLLSDFYEEYIIPQSSAIPDESTLKIDVCNKFSEKIENLKSLFLSVISDDSLSLPEKRAMLALFIREDDELFDDNVLLEELPTIDDCFAESLQLYIDEENRYEQAGNDPLLSCPRNNKGLLYLPLKKLKKSKAEVRKSQSYIRKCNKRLTEIKQAEKITEESKKRLTPEGFTFGETTYQLQHDIVERPLEKTYVPRDIRLESVDMRSGFSEIRNQGRIGSCTAFSTSSIFEYILNQIDSERKHLLSPRFLYYNVCKKNDDGTPIDRGSSLYDNIKSLGKDGICTEELCPYEEGFKIIPSDEAKENATLRLVTEAKNVNVSHADLTSALSEGYPIAISLKLFDSFGSNKEGFVFRPTDKELNSSDFGFHAMVLCGYSEEKKVYIVRNSWGKKFGKDGYCYIPFSYIEDPTLCRQACIITGVSCDNVLPAHNIEEKVNFDESSYAIEYAITRILMEEEKQVLTRLEKQYDTLNGEYIRLIRELTNQGKRGKLIDFAVNQIKEPMEKETGYEIAELPAFGISKWVIPLLGLSIAAGCFSINVFLGVFLAVISLIIGAYMHSSTVQKKIPASNKKENVGHISKANIRVSRRLEYLTAGLLIDSMSDFRNAMEQKHRYLTSYINHFAMWQKEEKKHHDEFDDKLKPPFNTILTKKDFEKVFNLKKEIYTGDIWLWKEFEDYEPIEEKVREFQTRLKNKLRNRIESSYREFTMSNFMMNSSIYDFLCSVEDRRGKWLNDIETQSLPFVRCSGMNPKPKKSLVVKLEEMGRQLDWEKYVTANYPNKPQCVYGGSAFKLTYIQTQGLSLESVTSLLD